MTYELPVVPQPPQENACGCGTEAIELHLCPYAADVHEDYSENCRCCDYCANECAMDV